MLLGSAYLNSAYCMVQIQFRLALKMAAVNFLILTAVYRESKTCVITLSNIHQF